MHRGELQHVIFEVGRRFDLKEIFIVGSAAILAAMPEPPEGELTATRDVDIVPPGDDDERVADQISFVLGEASAFDEEFGYHAQGVLLDRLKLVQATEEHSGLIAARITALFS